MHANRPRVNAQCLRQTVCGRRHARRKSTRHNSARCHILTSCTFIGEQNSADRLRPVPPSWHTTFQQTALSGHHLLRPPSRLQAITHALAPEGRQIPAGVRQPQERTKSFEKESGDKSPHSKEFETVDYFGVLRLVGAFSLTALSRSPSFFGGQSVSFVGMLPGRSLGRFRTGLADQGPLH